MQYVVTWRSLKNSSSVLQVLQPWLPCRSFWKSTIVKSFWKSTSQLVTKWSYLTMSVHDFPTKHLLNPHTPHQNPQTTEAVLHRCIWFQRPRPWVPRMGMSRIHFTVMAVRFPYIIGIYAKFCIHACWCFFQDASQEDSWIIQVSKVIPMYIQYIFLMFYHTPQLDDPPSLSWVIHGLSGPTPAMPRSPKLYSTSSLPAPTKAPNDRPKGWPYKLVMRDLTHGPGWCFRDPAKPLVFSNSHSGFTTPSGGYCPSNTHLVAFFSNPVPADPGQIFVFVTCCFLA